MDPLPERPDATPLTSTERVVVALDGLLATLLGIYAMVVAVSALRYVLSGETDSYGPGFAVMVLLVVGLSAFLFGLAAFAIARRWRVRWWIQAVAVLAGAWAVAILMGWV